jgi:DNA-binding PadR family transcriptional regulator
MARLIRQEIETITGRKCSIGALYTTIDRLETKGFLKTWMGDATPQRGGRAKGWFGSRRKAYEWPETSTKQ